MIGFGRLLTLVVLVSGLAAGPLQASESHCAGAAQPMATTAPDQQPAPMVVRAAGSFKVPPCDACTMPGCPVSLCPGGVPLESGVELASADTGRSAAPATEVPGPHSRTLQPPTPPPNAASLPA